MRTTSALNSRFTATLAVFVVVNVVLAVALGGGGTGLANVFKQNTRFTDPMYGTWTWWTIRAYFDEPRAPDVVLLGSSQMNSAAWAGDAWALRQPVDCIAHRRVVALEQKLKERLGGGDDLKVLNCAFQGAMASDYYMVGRALFSDDRKPKMVIVGVSPRDFIDNKLVAASATEPFRFLSPYVDTGQLSAIAFPDVYARLNAESEWALNRLGLRRVHDLCDSWVTARNSSANNATQTSESPLLNAIRNSSLRVKPGDYMVPADMRDVWVDNTSEYSERYKNPNPPSYNIQLAFFSKFLSLMQEKDIKTVVVGMPTLPMNRALLPNSFWSSYRQSLASLCTANGAQWCDMSENEQFQKHDFVDTVHVNTRGAIKLISAFAEVSTGAPELAEYAHRDTPIISPVSDGAARKVAGVQQGWN
ncbi:MAG TPA: hypothetical protein V6C81_29910 [Planktothrix sp.]